jgi:hypothetical protein
MDYLIYSLQYIIVAYYTESGMVLHMKPGTTGRRKPGRIGD